MRIHMGPQLPKRRGQMRKAIVLGTTVVAGIAVIAALSSWAGATMPSRGGNDQVRHLRAVATKAFNVDNDPSGISGGDMFGSSGDLRRHGNTIGRYTSTCTATGSDMEAQCQATFTWQSGGRIQLAGDFQIQSTEKNRLAIVGGTEKFRKVRGDATFLAANDDGSIQSVRLRIVR
jgi:hypothetical protein